MKTTSLILSLFLIGCVIFTMLPQSEAQGRLRKLKIAKKIAAVLLLHRKKYLFAVPFPLPIPMP